jgi:hypothetical protein
MVPACVNVWLCLLVMHRERLANVSELRFFWIWDTSAASPTHALHIKHMGLAHFEFRVTEESHTTSGYDVPKNSKFHREKRSNAIKND